MTKSPSNGAVKADDADLSTYLPVWWQRYFTGDLAHFWPPQLDAKVKDDGSPVLSRDNVFAIATTNAEHRELHTAVAAYVWGIGKNAYSIRWMVRAFTRNTDVVEDKLRLAASVLENDGPVAAYKAMFRGGEANMKFMGPAYFTKFLFFIGYKDTAAELRPLILDKRVATALRKRPDFPLQPRDGDWPSTVYEQYLTYCRDQNSDDPEAVEIALFNEGRARR